jgi:DNA-binding transcriptional regulator YiaG
MKKSKSNILNAVYETASDLNRLGFIDKKKMMQYEALCLEPIPNYTPTANQNNSKSKPHQPICVGKYS